MASAAALAWICLCSLIRFHRIFPKFSLFKSKFTFSFTVKVVPLKPLDAWIIPPCISTMFFAIASPRPVPPVANDRDCSTR